MREKFYQMDELQRARELQDEAAKLHIPVPVLLWQYEIKNAEGNIEEKGIGKSNSYTRNALNSIAYSAGLSDAGIGSTTAFQDGYVNAKDTVGTILAPSTSFRRDLTTTNPIVELGTSAAPENLDNYAVTASSLTAGINITSSVFNSITRKLITTISCTFKNNTASTINITESGVKIAYTNDAYGVRYYILYIHDIFTAVPVKPGQTITWTYVTEVAYPNP